MCFMELEKQVGEIVLKAMGQAISKTVAISEIIKKRIPGLHQETSISSMSITDMWELMEEGLVPYYLRHSYVLSSLEMTRQVSLISISLSTKELNKSSPGYLGIKLHLMSSRTNISLSNSKTKCTCPLLGY
ncbi:DNA/RNA-binding protein Alba-like - like 5 [Theobroma cacao]|nr:DNA/RNA-binding protein Alba-like - like 5 [Theobroma cacao]